MASNKSISQRTTKRRVDPNQVWRPPGPNGQTVRLDLAPGSIIGGRYKIRDAIGSGGMASVFRAKDNKFPDRAVALKFLGQEHLASQSAWDRIVREARVLAQLNHENIVRLFDYDRCDFGLYLALELIEGQSLRALIGTMNDELERVVNIIIQISSAVAAAHEKKVIHRDIKPENVMLTPEGRVKVMDFGIAHIVGRKHLTTSAPLMTIAYAAPEQQLSEAVEASDLFSIGCVFFELLKGEHPFLRPDMTLLALIAAMKDGRHSEIPASAGDLRPVIESLLSPVPAHRPPNARHLVEALETWRRSRLLPIKAHESHQHSQFKPVNLVHPSPMNRPASIETGVSGIAEIFLSRNEFDAVHDLDVLLGELHGQGRFRVVGKTLLTLLSQSDVLRKALSAGIKVELALVNPHAGDALFRKVPDVHIDDLAPAVRNFASIARWAEANKPSGTFEVRYHDEPLVDSFTEYDSPAFKSVMWELSFGQSRNNKRVLVLDPRIGIGHDVSGRYAKIWEAAQPQFHYERGEVVVPLRRDLQDYGQTPHRRMDILHVEERARARTEFEIRSAIDSDLGWMAALEKKYFGRAAIPESRLREWFTANSEGFSVLQVRAAKPVGFLNILPIRPEPLHKLKNGEIVERDVRKSMIYKLDEREAARELYIECLLIDEHRPRGLRYLLSHVRKLIRKVSVPERVRKLYALAATDDGASVLADLNFKPYLKDRPRKDGLKMYSISTFDLVLSCSKYLDDDDRTGSSAH